jgi:hypothetical protein
VSRKFVIIALYLIGTLLFFLNVFIIYSKTVLGHDYSFARWLYFDIRGNFTFYFSSALLAANVILLFCIVKQKALFPLEIQFWKILLATFSLFAIDEAFYIHQHFKMSTFGTIASYDQRSWTHYLWVIPYFAVFGTLFILLIRHAYAIPRQVKKKLVIAGFIFLSGAVVMEFAGTFYAVVQPKLDVYLRSIKTTEGVLQLVGSVMFLNIFYKQVRSKPSEKL